MSLKSLAEYVISRNQQCNTDATRVEFTRNNTPANSAPLLRSVVHSTPPHEREILEWLARIEETDPVIIRETLAKCRSNADALIFFLGLARGDDAGTVH